MPRKRPSPRSLLSNLRCPCCPTASLQGRLPHPHRLPARPTNCTRSPTQHTHAMEPPSKRPGSYPGTPTLGQAPSSAETRTPIRAYPSPLSTPTSVTTPAIVQAEKPFAPTLYLLENHATTGVFQCGDQFYDHAHGVCPLRRSTPRPAPVAPPAENISLEFVHIAPAAPSEGHTPLACVPSASPEAPRKSASSSYKAALAQIRDKAAVDAVYTVFHLYPAALEEGTSNIAAINAVKSVLSPFATALIDTTVMTQAAYMLVLAQITENAAVEAVNTMRSSYALKEGAPNIATVEAAITAVTLVLNSFATASIDTVAVAQGTNELSPLPQPASPPVSENMLCLYPAAAGIGKTATQDSYTTQGSYATQATSVPSSHASAALTELAASTSSFPTAAPLSSPVYTTPPLLMDDSLDTAIMSRGDQQNSSNETRRKKLISEVTCKPVPFPKLQVDVDAAANMNIGNRLLLGWIECTREAIRKWHKRVLVERHSSLKVTLAAIGFAPLTKGEEKSLRSLMSERTSRYVRSDVGKNLYIQALSWMFTTYVSRGNGET